jgi:hypothetical protein
VIDTKIEQLHAWHTLNKPLDLKQASPN